MKCSRFTGTHMPDTTVWDDSSDLFCDLFPQLATSLLCTLQQQRKFTFLLQNTAKIKQWKNHQKEPWCELLTLTLLNKLMLEPLAGICSQLIHSYLSVSTLQLKLKHRCNSRAACLLCVQVTLLVFFVSDARVHLCQSSSRKQFSSVEMLLGFAPTPALSASYQIRYSNHWMAKTQT